MPFRIQWRSLNKKLDVIRGTFSQQTKIAVPAFADILNVIGLDGASVIPVKDGE
jgi:hypothetical protein